MKTLLASLLLALAVAGCSPVYATTAHKHTPKCGHNSPPTDPPVVHEGNTQTQSVESTNQQQQGQLQGQLQGQSQSIEAGAVINNNTVEGGTGGSVAEGAVKNDNSNSNVNNVSTTSNYYNVNRTTFSSQRLGEVRVGNASKSVSTFSVQVQQDEDDFMGRSHSINMGVTVPIIFGKTKRTVNSAMGYEAQRMEDRNLHLRETHQAHMAEECVRLHTYVKAIRGRVERDSADGIVEVMRTDSPELWARCASYEHLPTAEDKGLVKRHSTEGVDTPYSSHKH